MKIQDIRNTIQKHPSKSPSYRSVDGITHLVIHHSLTTDGSAEAFARYHIGTLGWSRMGYAYVIKRDGTIQWASDWSVKTPHVGKHNRYCLGICVVGDFRTQEPTKEQYDSLYALIDYLQEELNIASSHVVGHQELSGYEWKQCPALDMDTLRGNVEYKSYTSVKNNFNNDTKLEILKPKRRVELLDLKAQWQWDLLAETLEEFYKDGILDSDRWHKKARNKDLTISELAFLNTILISRNIKKEEN